MGYTMLYLQIIGKLDFKVSYTTRHSVDYPKATADRSLMDSLWNERNVQPFGQAQSLTSRVNLAENLRMLASNPWQEKQNTTSKQKLNT